MVNFGGHVTALEQADCKGVADLYLVPYVECKQAIYESSEKFVAEWMRATEEASKDYQSTLQAIWYKVFNDIPHDSDGLRGLPLGDALRLFVEKAEPEDVTEIVQLLDACHTATVTNAEGLRKLVKKHDKKTTDKSLHLSFQLLPILYASPFFSGEAMLADSITTLRNTLDSVADDEGGTFKPLAKFDSEIIHQRVLESRFEELEWLKRLAESIPLEYMKCLVAHRGFHHVGDRNDRRPLENSTASFELAWTSGIHLCECDIALTKDEKLVMAHDESFKRLALDSKSPISGMRVSDLTFRELISLPLKSGVRPPLLIDVLRSAQAIADDARLIIEIKPGNPEVASALSRLLIRHPELCPCVAMIMSFDAVCMHRLREELSTEYVSGGFVNPNPSRLSLVGGPNLHRRVASFDHFGTVARGLEEPDNLGLSLSQVQLDGNMMQQLASSPQTTYFPKSPSISRIALQRATSIDEMSAVEHAARNAAAALSGPKLPELMLITVCEEPNHPSELRVELDDFSPIESWLAGTNATTLDGVYLQYQKEMKSPEGAAALRKLSQRHKVGIWMLADRDPDDYATLEYLAKECNVSYINTDLPISFRTGYSPKGSAIYDD